MAKRMLIDATQAEETRIAVMDNDRLDSYDFDSAARKLIKGNIFLAKVTRVEPSLQACFVEYGGQRQGFLAFTEIHPDYYKIPVEDRQALLAEEAAIGDEEEDEDDLAAAAKDANADGQDFEATPPEMALEPVEHPQPRAADFDAPSITGDASSDENDADDAPTANNVIDVPRDNTVETVGGAEEDEQEESAQKSRVRRIGRLRRRYKIQEVIKRRQIMLVQATKEERGQKGAAMTTYISLPGRYCVLMPNSPRGGGISRKVTDPQARRKMKDLLTELDLPNGMSVILRTAGMTRTRLEIKRDLEYLLKLWEEICRETMQSVAPALIYEEADIFKRAIRDLYSRDTTEIIVAGSEGFKKVKTFMRQMVPASAKRVLFYRDPMIPLFQRFSVEKQIADIFSPRVELKSGGYIIINPTEALVSIDVNSGRATRERHIDDTALKTNIEAAEEIARQLRLRDLGGLVVIDFIDMDSNRHNAKVERKLREAMAEDRARIEIGRISGFGLLELSRQRLHPSLTETHFHSCAHCAGTGLVRTIESAAVVATRAIEAEAVKGRAVSITASLPQPVAVYMLNHKREELNRIEEYFGCKIALKVDENMIASDMEINFEKGTPNVKKNVEMLPVPEVEGTDDYVAEDEDDSEPLMSSNDTTRGARDREENSGDDTTTPRGGDDQRRGRNGRNNRRGRSGRGPRPDRNDRGPRRQNGDQPATGSSDIISIPISDGAQAPRAPHVTGEPRENREPREPRAPRPPREPGELGENGEPRDPRRRRRGRRGGRGRHNRRDGQPNGPIDGADAPKAEPANVTPSQPQAVRKPEPATAGGGEEKRGWWKKILD